MTKAARLGEKQLRIDWLVRSAPFELRKPNDVQVSVARAQEWERQGVSWVIVDRDGGHWITFGHDYYKHNRETPEEVLLALNDEAAVAVMVQGTPAEKMVK